ncbi:MBL fold metallo-hydrolase [Mycobacterium sp. LTG2003]
MRLHAFHATDGDCLLLESADGRRVLIDGGRSGSFKECTRPVLDELVADDQVLDLVVVSHIDADHISGIIPLLDAVEKWASFEHQLADAAERDGLRPPKVPKPPEIKAIWHNSWRRQLGDKLADPAGNLARSVGAAVDLAFRADATDVPEPALALANLATSVKQGEDLMLRIEGARVPIPFNEPFNGMVLLRKPVHVERLGDLNLHVLGPAKKHVDELRDEFTALLDAMPRPARAGRTAPGGRRTLAVSPDVGGVPLDMALDASLELIENVVAAHAELIKEADASKVTVPNRASIILLAEERGRTCLLTGDAAMPEIIDGLKAAKLLGREPFRCNVLKVQHHGAEHNVSADFARRVLAEHYVLSGNGASGNPNPSVVRTIVETRLDADPATPFTLWFTTSDTRPDSETKRTVMRAAIAEATKAEQDHPGMLFVRVLRDDETVHTIDV